MRRNRSGRVGKVGEGRGCRRVIRGLPGVEKGVVSGSRSKVRV